jgi:FAD/FMN-containing dehydrogenase/Fe-S oxidoreductase
MPEAPASDVEEIVGRLRRTVSGDVRFDSFTRGRYAADASAYQIVPTGVVMPRTSDDVAAVLDAARADDLSVIARGAGTSQNGQPIGRGLVVDCSRYFNNVIDYEPGERRITVEPGMVLETLNARIAADGLFFPVEPSTSSRCTIGGMTGNNSSGARSMRYGIMADNVIGVSGLLADGERFAFAPPAGVNSGVSGAKAEAIMDDVTTRARAERDEISRRVPHVQRRVAGYNVDRLLAPRPNPASLLVGSEGTLAFFTAVTLALSPLPAHRVMAVCNFPSLRAAMETTSHLVALNPVAVELVDNNVLALGATNPAFARVFADVCRGNPDSLLLVEFAGDSPARLHADLTAVDACMADHGFPSSVVEVREASRQRALWQMREACLNIMMSMKGDGKPVSFIEDCAVPLEHLADYTEALTELFARYGTRGTWYGHASVGCLHVRPILNMKSNADLSKMRAIAEAACDLVVRFKGSHSGEHGDGISRSEFHGRVLGARMVRLFEDVKDAFDPDNRLNPGKIVRAPRMDNRSLMRFPHGYATTLPGPAALDWSEWGGFGGAVEMCNNNGTCRKLAAGTMCPSYRVTREEKHVTRGRANTLRLAISGQLGPDAFVSDEMKQTLDLCVSCKGCRRECPTGVDMSRMKIEFLHHYHRRHGTPLREQLIAYLPRYAPFAASIGPLLAVRDRFRSLATMSEWILGFSARRSLPRWQRPWREPAEAEPPLPGDDGRDIVLFADTFNRHFEPETLSAMDRVFRASGYRVRWAKPANGRRPLCCGRTFLAAGMVEEARAEVRRTIAALAPFVARGARVIGAEPSCVFTFRDEALALLPRNEVADVAAAVHTVEEVLAGDLDGGRIVLPAMTDEPRVAHVHTHCHQKAFNSAAAVEALLGRVPNLTVKKIESSCCGMAGAFGYRAETIDHSLAMGELTLLPAVRAAGAGDVIVADGTSCRHQIHDGTGRKAVATINLLDEAIRAAQSPVEYHQLA